MDTIDSSCVQEQIHKGEEFKQYCSLCKAKQKVTNEINDLSKKSMSQLKKSGLGAVPIVFSVGLGESFHYISRQSGLITYFAICIGFAAWNLRNVIKLNKLELKKFMLEVNQKKEFDNIMTQVDREKLETINLCEKLKREIDSYYCMERKNQQESFSR